MMKLLLIALTSLTYASPQDDNSDLFTSSQPQDSTAPSSSRAPVSIRRMTLDDTHPSLSTESTRLFSSHLNAMNQQTSALKLMEASSAVTGGLLDGLQPFADFYKRKFEFNVDRLPDTNFLLPSPWPNDYWASYKDGINVVWGDSQSASEKYALAFGLDVKAVMTGVSEYNGIDSFKNTDKTACTSQDNCSAHNDGSVCGIRAGETSGFCIPSWYGIVSYTLFII